MTLDKTWELCLQMWKWIAEMWEPGMSVNKLKKQWLEEYEFSEYELRVDCFFCTYAGGCDDCAASCPGAMVDETFHCEKNLNYDYRTKPKEFYVELVRLNTIRLEKKNMATLTCEDGTVVQISASTEAELRRAFGPKPEPTYKVGDIFWKNMTAHKYNHYTQLRAKDGRVGLCNTGNGYPVYEYHTIQDINAITFAEVQSMTRYPKGLRYVDRFIITEK